MVVLSEANLALLQLLLLELVHVLLVPPVAEVVRLDYDIKVVLQHQDDDDNDDDGDGGDGDGGDGVTFM